MSDATLCLEARGLSKTYGRHELAVRVLDGTNLELKRGEVLAVRGRSGSGKTTLLFLLGLLDSPSAGEVLVAGEPTAAASARRRAELRNQHFGFIFQAYYLVPELTALENILLPTMVGRSCLGWLRERKALRREAEALLERFGLGARKKYRPAKLSGGEQQRVAIARALISRPTILFCDEPTGNLDEETGESVSRQILEVTREAGRAAIIVTHDPGLAARADRVVRLERGRIYPN